MYEIYCTEKFYNHQLNKKSISVKECLLWEQSTSGCFGDFEEAKMIDQNILKHWLRMNFESVIFNFVVNIGLANCFAPFWSGVSSDRKLIL